MSLTPNRLSNSDPDLPAVRPLDAQRFTRVRTRRRNRYVAKYSASAAEMWARSHGATDAESKRRGIVSKSPPSRTAQAGHWTAQ